MKTTQMYVEQVIIGMLVLLAIGLFIGPVLFAERLFGTDFFSNLSIGLADATLIVMAAYLLGMVYDRVADTILDETDRHNRLRFALFNTAREAERLGRIPKITTDPFNETALRIQAMKRGEAADYTDYLRSRMRLMRALCGLVPLYTVIASLYLTSDMKAPLGNHPVWVASGVTMLVVYGLVLLFGVAGRSETWHLPPKTGDLPAVNMYAVSHIDVVRYTKKTHDGKRAKVRVKWLVRDGYRDPAWGGFMVIVLTSVWVLAMGNVLQTHWPLPVAGLLLTVLVGWVWQRVSKTFMLFLQSYREYDGTGKS